MRVDILSLFPGYFESPLNTSILGRALREGFVDVYRHDIRSFACDIHQTVDDKSFGGGPGMVMMAGPLTRALESIKKEESHVIYFSPAGKRLTRDRARALADHKHLILICGHYEGIDQRFIQSSVDEEISIGDFVLTNGALAALVLLDATVRFLPQVLGSEVSHERDSFEGPWLDHPHYTLPRNFENQPVPPVLLMGDHAKIEKFRQTESLTITDRRRPDLAASWGRFLRGEGAGCSLEMGACLGTSSLGFYRKAFGKYLGLPWIEKNATMGALLLGNREIVLWQTHENFEFSKEDSTQKALSCERKEQSLEKKSLGEGALVYLELELSSLGVKDKATFVQAAKRLKGKSPVEVELGETGLGIFWVCFKDQAGWRLLLELG